MQQKTAPFSVRRRGNTPEGRGESRGDSKRKRLVVPSPSLWSERGYILWRTRPAAPLRSRSSFPRPRKTGGKSTLLPAARPFFCGDWARTHAAEPPSPRKCRAMHACARALPTLHIASPSPTSPPHGEPHAHAPPTARYPAVSAYVLPAVQRHGIPEGKRHPSALEEGLLPVED